MPDPHTATKKLAPETPLAGIALQVDTLAARAKDSVRRQALARTASAILACIATCSLIAAGQTDESVAPSPRAPRQLMTKGDLDAGVEARPDAETHSTTSPHTASADGRTSPRANERPPRGRVGNISWASMSGTPLKVPIPAAQLAGFQRDGELAQLARHVRNACRSTVAAQQAAERKSVHATAHIEIAASGAVRVTGVTGNAPLVSACVARAAASHPLRPGRGETRELPFSWVAQ